MLIFIIITFILWVYLLSVLSRSELHFFKFLIGAVGFFFFGMYFLTPIFLKPVANAVAAVAGILGDITGYFKAFYEYSLIFVSRSSSFISFYIDYECSGIIEILAFSSLLWFFPLYDISEKIALTLLGMAWIFFANVLRIFVICILIYYFGNNVFYFAHTVFGRILFYVLSVVMYFYVFTKAHVIRQKVGQFRYGNIINKDN